MRMKLRRQAAAVSQLPVALTNPGVMQLWVEATTEAFLLTGPRPPRHSKNLTTGKPGRRPRPGKRLWILPLLHNPGASGI